MSSISLSRRRVVAGLLASVAAPALAEAPVRSPVPVGRPGTGSVRPVRVVADGAQALIEAAKLGGAVGFVVADARTGAVLEQVNGALGLPPASVAKTMTALYALDALGADYRFSTRLIATGPVQGGRIAGDLILAGGGDPTLDTDRLAAMAKALKAKGVTGVAGRFLVWGGALPAIDRIDRGQPDHVGYNPAIGGLNLNYNRVYFEWRRGGDGYSVSMDARSEVFRPVVAMAAMQVVDRGAPLYTFEARGGVDRWTVARSALGDNGSRWLPVRQPALYAGQAFQSLAGALGISLPGPEVMLGGAGAAVGSAESGHAPTYRAGLRGTVLVQQFSADLATILRDMLRYSTNITAEVLGLTASRARGGKPASLQASAALMNGWLARTYGLQVAAFVDHSGLGGATRIAPADLVQALVKAGPGGPLRGLMRSVGLRDAAADDARAAAVQVNAKTGTLNFVSGLGGYVHTPGGGDLVFAIFCADVARRDRVPMADREQPPGGQAWVKRARHLQQALLGRWVAVYGA